MAQVLPSPVDSVASAEAMEEDVDACLTGASVIDPVVQEESVPVPAEAVLSAVPAVMDDAKVFPQPAVDEDNAASQDCPSWPFSSQQSEASLDLFDALASIQNDSAAGDRQ